MLFCAGAVKAGTSWLYEYLRGHPETYLRSIKEMQFFNKLDEGALGARVKRMEKDIAGMQKDLDSGKARFPAWVIKQIADRVAYCQVLTAPDPVAAYMRYLTAEAEGKRLVGEMTPEYGLLPVTRMRDLQALSADVRWVFVMRDPVERLWSHVRMLVKRASVAPGAFAAACVAKFNDVLAGQAPDVVQRGDYAAIHARLVQAVPDDNRLVMTYEGMITPQGVGRVTDFLGLSRREAPLQKRVHAGTPVNMPESLHQRAREWLRPQYAFVAATLGLPQDWESFPEFGSEVA
jgi:hypothetical protein